MKGTVWNAINSVLPERGVLKWTCYLEGILAVQRRKKVTTPPFTGKLVIIKVVWGNGRIWGRYFILLAQIKLWSSSCKWCDHFKIWIRRKWAALGHHATLTRINILIPTRGFSSRVPLHLIRNSLKMCWIICSIIIEYEHKDYSTIYRIFFKGAILGPTWSMSNEGKMKLKVKLKAFC